MPSRGKPPTKSQLRKWSLGVRRAAFFRCDVCGYKHAWHRKRRELHAHHLRDKSTYPNDALDLDNGVCVCEDCHDRFHDEYMGGSWKTCTPEDYIRFKGGSGAAYWIAMLVVGLLLI